MKLKACRECKKFTEQDVCDVCNVKTTENWVGFLAVSDPSISAIAKSMGIKVKGKYALKVR